MTRWLVSALLIALVMVMALLSLADTPGDASHALPVSTAPFVQALRAEAPIDQRPVRSAAPTTAPSATVAAGGLPIASRSVLPAPTPMPRHAVGTPLRAFTGQSSWWYSFGPGAYAAMRPDLHVRNGTLVTVCAGGRCYPDPVKVITTCQCLGPGSNRIIDLSRDVFAWFAPPSQGVLQVTVEVTP